MQKYGSLQWGIVSRIGGAPETVPANLDANTNTKPYYKYDRASLAVALIVILASSIVAPSIYRYLARVEVDTDALTYAQAGKEILAGRRLYSEIYMDKGPLTVIAFAIPQLFSPRNSQAIGESLSFVLMGLALIFAWAYRFNPSAMAAAGSFIILFPMTSRNFFWFSSEHISNLFVAGNLVIAYKIARRQSFSFIDCFLVGFISCLALNVRQTALLSGIVPAVLWIKYAGTWNRILKAIACGFLGGILAFLIILLVVAHIGDIHEYLYMIFTHPSSYAGDGSWHRAWRLFADNAFKPLTMFVVIFLGYAIFSRYKAVVISAVIAGVLTCAIPRHDFSHYLAGLFPYMALSIGIGFDRNSTFDQIFAWACVAFTVCVCVPLAKENIKTARLSSSAIDMADIAPAIDRVAPPSASLFVWGPMGSEAIMFASRLPAANKFWILWMFNHYASGSRPVSVSEITSEYLANPPTVMAMDQNYRKADESPSSADDFRVGWELGKALLSKYKYVVKESKNGFDIAVLQATSEPATRPAFANPIIP
jgi:hypothetical protein